MKKLILYIARYKKSYILGAVFAVFTSIAGIFIPWILKYAVDDLSKNISYEKILKFSGLIILASVAEGIFRYFMRRITIGASRRIEYDLRNDYFYHLQKLPLSFYDQNNTGDLMSRGTSDLNAIRMLLGPGIMYSADTITTFIFAFTMMVLIDVKLSVLSLIPLVLLTIIIAKMGGKLSKLHETVQEKISEVSRSAQEYLSGIRIIKSFVREETVSGNFREKSDEYLRASLKVTKMWGMFFPLMFLMSGLSTLIVLLFGGKMVILKKITLGDFVAFNGFLTLLVWPMMAIGWVINLFQAGIASMKRIDLVMDQAPSLEIIPPDSKPRQPLKKIEFVNLNFSYPGKSEKILKDINFVINPGEIIAIMGKIGSGKTTLVNLVAHFYETENNMLFINGEDINKIPMLTIREHIGFVPQETFLFSDSINNNLIYGLKNVPPDNIIEESAANAGMLNEINGLPEKFETMLGERGINLSGGQKQRMSISRTLITNPSIIIFDDCFSSMDVETERTIMKNLEAKVKDKTIIIIGHRTSTIRMADRIIVLDEGRIAESGTHEKLLRKNGLYAVLYHLESLKEELETNAQ
ncbi:MAG: ABC transporter ATP-binding protein [bacterium]